ncbi:MAG: HAMP domain-containing histidine kinase [Opitutae bacterium]|nr:HAMP domain-containing histidine kinase [Opitutae bacterium]
MKGRGSHAPYAFTAQGGPTPAEKCGQLGRALSATVIATGALVLGLTLVQHLIDRSGGTLRIESTPGTGTVAIAMWPRNAGAHEH